MKTVPAKWQGRRLWPQCRDGSRRRRRQPYTASLSQSGSQTVTDTFARRYLPHNKDEPAVETAMCSGVRHGIPATCRPHRHRSCSSLTVTGARSRCRRRVNLRAPTQRTPNNEGIAGDPFASGQRRAGNHHRIARCPEGQYGIGAPVSNTCRWRPSNRRRPIYAVQPTQTAASRGPTGLRAAPGCAPAMNE